MPGREQDEGGRREGGEGRGGPLRPRTRTRGVSARTDFYWRGRLKTRPRVIARLRDKCGWTGSSERRSRMDGRNGRSDGNFCPRSSFLTTLAHSGLQNSPYMFPVQILIPLVLISIGPVEA
jgi:hypothetical protein